MYVTFSVLFCLCVPLSALHVRNPSKEDKSGPSLKDWLSDGRCFNMLLTPQYNNQHSMFGITDFLRNEKLLKNLGGVSAGSGGTLPGAFAAADKNFALFDSLFPREGWGGLGPSEPKITNDYVRILNGSLPRTFEELKYPLGLSLTHWDDIDALKKFDHNRQRGFAVSSGNLHEAMQAAVATSGGHKTCPYCIRGFWPRTIENKFPVTDGAFGDIWGATGLQKIPRCEKVLHLLPLDYPDQVGPPMVSDLPQSPREMVSLSIVQPPIASHGYLLEYNLGKTGKAAITLRSSEEWNKAMFNNTNKAMLTAVNTPLSFSPSGKGKVAVITLDGGLAASETMSEQLYDRMLSLSRDQFWTFYGGEGTSSWSDQSKVMLLNEKLMKKHGERLMKDIKSGDFGPH